MVSKYNCLRKGGVDISQFMTWNLLTVATLFDARDYKIPNQLIALGYVAGLFINVAQYHLAGTLIFIFNITWPILLLYLLYLVGGLGAGDIKLFSVMAPMVGAGMTENVMILSLFLAAAVAVGLCIYEKRIYET